MSTRREAGEVVLQGKGATDFRFLSRFRAPSELRVLNMANNQLQRLLGLENHTDLVRLDLSQNEVWRIEGLQSLARLEVLRLRQNNITAIEGLEQLTRLQTLDLANNDIQHFASLQHNRSLTNLDLSYNSLSILDDISALRGLQALNLRGNLIKLLDSAPRYLPESLRVLDLGHNSIGDVAQLQHLAPLLNLERLNVDENVFVATARHCGFTYRPLVLAMLPSLQSLDGERTRRSELDLAHKLFSGDGRNNRHLLDDGYEPQLLRWLVQTCPAVAEARGSGAAAHGREAITVDEFEALAAQVKEMRKYVKQYVKAQARKRDRAAMTIQRVVRGLFCRAQNAEAVARLRRRGLARTTEPSRKQDAAPALGTVRTKRTRAPQRAQPFDALRYQLPCSSKPSHHAVGGFSVGWRPGRRGSRPERKGAQQLRQERAARAIQRWVRGTLVRLRLEDYHNCQSAAIKIQSSWRGLAQRRRLGIGGAGGRDTAGRPLDRITGAFGGLAAVAEDVAELRA